MQKTKLLFMMINMNIGGTEKALLNLLDEIDPNNFTVTVVLLEATGGFLTDIPDWVQVEYLQGYERVKELYKKAPFQAAKQLMRAGKLMQATAFFATHLIYKVTHNRHLYFQVLTKYLSQVEGDYDIAIAYAGPMDLISYYVTHKIKAEKKVQWVHFDVTKIGFDAQYAAKLYQPFDKIYVVSSEGRAKFIDLLPKFANKTEVMHNLISTKKIQQLAQKGQGFTDEFSGVRIVTVGRLSHEKGQDLIMQVVAKLKRDGYNIRWYVIGEGNLRSTCEALIAQYNIETECILLGSQKNPYPYMKQADLYVQTSRHEGYCITLAEAKALQKPIVTTNFTGASEHVTDETIGQIVEISEQGLYEGIKKHLKKGDETNETTS
ncbi:MAG: glycosyltransferase [Culicoidibacterales bacterium]